MSKRMFLLFSHSLTELQKKDAKESLGVVEFIELPLELQKLWSNIPPEINNLNSYLEPIKNFIKDNAKKFDIVLIQGDFGGCYKMVTFVKSLNLKAVHSTTKRDAVEKIVDGKVVKTSTFEHIIFREF